MALHTLQDLLIEELRDLYDAEHRILKALPKMAKAASSTQLRTAFEDHLEETQMHVKRLEEVFGFLDEKPKKKTCHGIMGLLEEGEEFIKDKKMNDNVRDAGLISAAQRVEHYEMAGYGCVRTFARILGHVEAEELLQQTLDEEGNADKTLTEIAETAVNAQAVA